MEIPYFYIHVESYVWQKDHYIHQFFARYSCTYCCTGRHDKSIFILPSIVRHPTKNSTFLRTHNSTGTEQIKSFVWVSGEPIAKGLPGGGGYFKISMPLDLANGFTMVIFFFFAKSFGR